MAHSRNVALAKLFSFSFSGYVRFAILRKVVSQSLKFKSLEVAIWVFLIVSLNDSTELAFKALSSLELAIEEVMSRARKNRPANLICTSVLAFIIRHVHPFTFTRNGTWN